MLSRLPKLLRWVLLSVVAFFLFLVIVERLLDRPTTLLLWSCLPRQALENRGLGSGKAATPACAGLDRASLLQGGRTGEFSYLDSLLRPYRARQHTDLEVEPVAI